MLAPRSRTNLLLSVRLLVALAAFLSGVAELAGLPPLVAEFDLIGLGQWFRYFTGAVLIMGSVLLILPRTIAYGALILCAVCIGALVAHLLVLHGDVIHTIIPAAVLGGIAWQYRDRLTLARRSAT